MSAEAANPPERVPEEKKEQVELGDPYAQVYLGGAGDLVERSRGPITSRASPLG